jgi:sialate O-acetylesterase
MYMRSSRYTALKILCLWYGMASTAALAAQLHLAPVFTDNMVLQREQPIRVWGGAAPGDPVQVSLGNATKKTKADARGQWLVEFPALPAGGPYIVRAKSRSAQYTLQNILIGDVWICAGQSNMRWRVRDSYGADMEKNQALNPALRLLDLEGTLEPINKRYPLDFLTQLSPSNYYKPSAWNPADSNAVALFSAVGYFFGKELQQKTSVPIGLIQTAVGGVPLETYLAREALPNDSLLSPLGKPGWLDHPLYPRWTAERVRQNLAAWYEEAPDKPMPDHPFAPGFLYDAAIRPLLNMPVKGVIWYQGESNATFSADSETMDPSLNAHKLRQLVQSWRNAWHNDSLFFFMVQLPAIRRDWEAFREVQLHIAQQIPHTGIAVTLDLGHASDVHPREKQIVGQRLARLALAQTYRFPIVAGGPQFTEALQKEGKMILRFEYSGQGLASRDGLPLNGFLIAGPDRVFLPATVTIRGNELECSHPNIPNPVAVRYAWDDFPDRANLINREGLPASPFRTDDW